MLVKWETKRERERGGEERKREPPIYSVLVVRVALGAARICQGGRHYYGKRTDGFRLLSCSLLCFRSRLTRLVTRSERFAFLRTTTANPFFISILQSPFPKIWSQFSKFIIFSGFINFTVFGHLISCRKCPM